MGAPSLWWVENLVDRTWACGADTLLWSGCWHWVHTKWPTTSWGALVFLLLPLVASVAGALILYFRRTAVCQEEQNQAQALAKKYVEHAQSLLSSQCAADRQVAIRLLDVALRYQPSKPLAIELKARTLLKLQRFEEVIWLLGRSWDEAAASAALPASGRKLSPALSLGAFPVTLKRPSRVLWAAWQHIGGGACAVVAWACLWLARLLGGGGFAWGQEARDSPPWRWLLIGQAWYQLGQLEMALAYLQRAREEMREQALKERHTWTHDRFPCPVAPSRPAAKPRPFHPSSSHRAGPTKGMPNEAATAMRLMTAIRNMLRRKAAAEEALAAGRFTEATRHLTMVVEGPRPPPLAFGAACFVLRGSAHEECGRAMDALLDYTRAAALDPTSGGGLARRAKLLERLRCFAESALDVQKLQEVCEARAWAEGRGLPHLSPMARREGSGRAGSEGGTALPPPKQGGLAKDGSATGGGRAGALSLSASLLHGSPSPSPAGVGDNGTALNGCEGRWWVVSLEEAETKLAELFWRAEVQDGNDRGMDRWALLGLPCGASREEVETAHRVTALRHDPGKAGDFLDRWESLDKASLQSLRLSIRRDSARMFRLLHRACSEVLERLPPSAPQKRSDTNVLLLDDCAKKNKREENLPADERDESAPRSHKDNKPNGNGPLSGYYCPPRSSSPHGLPPRPETRLRSNVSSSRSGHGKRRKATHGVLDDNTPRSIPSSLSSCEENALSSFSLAPKHAAKPLPNLRLGCDAPEPAGGTPWLEPGLPKQVTGSDAPQVSGGALGGIDRVLAKGEDGGSIREGKHLEKLQAVALHLASYFETQGFFFFESNVCPDDAQTIMGKTETETETKPSSPPPLHSVPSSSFHSPSSSSGGKSPRSQGERECRSTAGEFFEIGHFCRHDSMKGFTILGDREEMSDGGMDSMIMKRSDVEEGKGRVQEESVGPRSVVEVGKENMSYPSLTICLASWDSKHSNALWFPV